MKLEQTRFLAAASLLTVAACGETSDSLPDPFVANGPHLIVTTTDFSTGAISLAAVDDRRVAPDVALGSTDAIPFFHDRFVYVVNRFNHDYIDVLDPQSDFASVSQHPVVAPHAASANPQSVAFCPDGTGVVPLFEAPTVQFFDFNLDPAGSLLASADLSVFAVADEQDHNPDLSLAIAHGDEVLVSAQRLDRTGFPWTPKGDEVLIRIDCTSRSVVGTEITLLGNGAKQHRPDPIDPADSVLILTSGIERVNLTTGDVSWAVDASLFAAADLGRLDLQSFALHGDETAYVAAYNDDFQVDIWRVALDGAQTLDLVIGGLSSVDKTLEVIGDELWAGDTTPGHAGLRVFDLTVSPPQLAAGPLSTGLAPYSMILMP